MSYSDTRWISKFTWDAIWDKTITLQTKAASFSLASDSDSASLDPNGPMLLVNGFIRPAENVGSIRPSYVLPPGVADAAKIVKSLDALGAMPAENPYKLRLLDGAGHALAQYPLLLSGQADGSKAQLGFVQFVPWSPAVRRLQLVKNETVLGETVVSEHGPGLTLSAPVVNEAEQAIELSWTATDPDSDPLVFTIQYSADNGLKWLTLRLNTPFTTTRLNSSMLPGTQARLRVIASDGLTPPSASRRRLRWPKTPPSRSTTASRRTNGCRSAPGCAWKGWHSTPKRAACLAPVCNGR
jgi:hypothetical protein